MSYKFQKDLGLYRGNMFFHSSLTAFVLQFLQGGSKRVLSSQPSSYFNKTVYQFIRKQFFGENCYYINVEFSSQTDLC